VAERYVGHAQAGRIYDHIGRWQDTRPLSERRAIDALVERAAFERAGAVLEFGCGTGRLAARLLAERLPAGARYLGLDVSPGMVRLARAAVAPWGDRARVELTGGAMTLPAASGAFDRVVSTYVVDLLSPEDAAQLLGEAYRVLRPGGLLALASLTPGRTPLSRTLTRAWRAVWRLDPALVGGCRPVRLAQQLPPDAWTPRARLTVTDLVLASEVVIAERR
jgi:ubiquinone/menaquinone biosynthesis C-methylase UbiE